MTHKPITLRKALLLTAMMDHPSATAYIKTPGTCRIGSEWYTVDEMLRTFHMDQTLISTITPKYRRGEFIGLQFTAKQAKQNRSAGKQPAEPVKPEGDAE